MEKVKLVKLKDAVVCWSAVVKYRGHTLWVSWDDVNGYDYDTPEGWTDEDMDEFHDSLDESFQIIADVRERA